MDFVPLHQIFFDKFIKYDIMLKGFFNVPKAVNEPVKSYTPKSPEKKAVLEAY